MKGRFDNLVNGKKRANKSNIPRPLKLPKASEISIEQGPRPKQAPTRLPVTAPVDVCIYRYTEQASDLWNLMNGCDYALYQVQIRHEAQRAITFAIRDSFRDFLREAHKQDPRIPENLHELESRCGVKPMATDRTDPDDVGFVQWRAVFYCIDVANIMFLLDGFFKFKERQTTQPFQVVIHPHIGIDVATMMGDLGYKHYTLQENKKVIPLHVFEAQPVTGKRITWLNIQIENQDIMSIVITGNTWPYRQRLDDIGVLGGYHNADDDKEKHKYFRVWNQIDVSDEEQQLKFMKMLGDDVFKNLCMRVTLDSYPMPGTAVQKFIDGKLREQPCLFFTSTPQNSKDEEGGGEQDDEKEHDE